MAGIRLLQQHYTLAFFIFYKCMTQEVFSFMILTNTLERCHRHEQQIMGIPPPLLPPRQPQRRHITTQLHVERQGFGNFESLKLLADDDDDEEVSSAKNDSVTIKQQQEERIVLLNDFSASKPIPYQSMWTMQKEFVNDHIDRIKKNEFKNNPQDGAPLPPTVSQFSSNVEYSFLDFDDGTEQYSRVEKGHDSIILLQHEPVYTLGTGSDSNFIKERGTINTGEKSANGMEIDVVRIERGGEVTYHGPGQLVAYPILDLRGYKKDLHWYMRALEEAIIIALTNVGIHGATREDGVTGVWVNGKKIGAMGIKVKRWVTMHGLSVNVDQRSMENFNGIVPCGLVGREVCCINEFLEEPITVEEFAAHLMVALQDVLEVTLKPKNLL